MEPVFIVLLSLLGIILALVIILIIRTFMFKPEKLNIPQIEALDVDADKAFYDLAEMVKCKTISHADKSKDDANEFEKFKALLPKLFPNIYEKCSYEEVGERALLFKLQGINDSNPTVLMAHYDVVSVKTEKWEHPPFDGAIIDGVLWGRGTLDTKATLNGAMQALEGLLKTDFIPKNDLYLAFAGDEEVNGCSANLIVDLFEKKGITPALVLDEGGAVVEKVFPGVHVPSALIGIAEKGMLNVEFTCESNGGHSSAPKPHTPVGKLSQACVNVENHPFKMRFSPASWAMLSTLAKNSTFIYRMMFANMWLFAPIFNIVCKKTGGELNALVRTTCAFTQMEGSQGMNVIPPKATMVANLRLIPGDTVEGAIEYLNKTVKNKEVKISKIYGNNPSRTSLTNSEGYERIKNAIACTWQGAIVSPYLMVACSDSRHWGRISDKVYRFSAMALSTEERGTIHGNNERIPYDTVKKTVEFYTRIIKNS